MLEPTAVALGPSEVPATAYVGHYSILGAPQAAGMFGRTSRGECEKWEPSLGATLGDNVVIGHHTIIDDGSVIGPNVWIGSNVRIGHDCRIAADVQIYYCAQIYDRVTIGPGAWVGGFICNDTAIGDHAIVLGTTAHRFVDATVGTPEPAPTIEARAFVGMGAYIIGGITVGAAAYVAAGAILLHDALPGRLYVGNPAREIGEAPRPLAVRGATE